jgi:hypothetical protein
MWHCSSITWSLFFLEEQWHQCCLTHKESNISCDSLLSKQVNFPNFGGLLFYRTQKLYFFQLWHFFKPNNMLRIYSVWAHHLDSTDYRDDFCVICLRPFCWGMLLLHHCELSGADKCDSSNKPLLTHSW